MKGLAGDGGRFLIAGGLNSLVSLALYQGLMFVMPATAAYALTWVIGVALVSVIYPRLVFSGVKQDRGNSAITAAVYVCGFLLGLAVIALADRAWPGNRWSIVITMALTTAFNFIALRLLLRRAGEA